MVHTEWCHKAGGQCAPLLFVVGFNWFHYNVACL